ncbi:MAG: dihydroorotase [Saprospiraceae bacterium]
MQTLLKSARIFDGRSESRAQDILIENGLIKLISDRIPVPQEAKIWESPNLCVSPGWLDLGVYAADPGFEHREDLYTTAAAAAAGGFTSVACFPNTDPAIHTKSEILYVKNKAAVLPVQVYPIGAISQGCEGKDLAELFDMHAVGAIAFSDGKRSVQDAGLLLRALQYAKAFNGLVINVPHHKTIAAGGQIHEGLMSTTLGLKGLPALAEELMVQRDLSLLEYSEGRLHIHLISTAKSVELIRAAKRAGLSVTCSVAVANLCFTDEKLANFDSNWKIVPPLRSSTDTAALVEGLCDGTIDFICSNHTPWHEEAKNQEFSYAEFGMIGMETAFSLCRTFLNKKLKINDLVEKLSLGARRVLKLEVPKIAQGERADLTVFDPDAAWVLEEKDIRSKSKNTPFIGQKFQGKALVIINGK